MKISAMMLCCALLCAKMPCAAETRTLTLRQALELALQQNPDIVLARLDQQRARDQVTINKAPFSPTVYAGSGLAWTLYALSMQPQVLCRLRAELEGRGVDVKDGQWGYRLMVIADPDGNELYFPYPASLATGSLITSNLEQPR